MGVRHGPARADVARAASVAPSTVSTRPQRCGRDVKIAPATSDRVKQAAQDLNFHIPNAAARVRCAAASTSSRSPWPNCPTAPSSPVVHTVLDDRHQRRSYLLLLFQVTAPPTRRSSAGSWATLNWRHHRETTSAGPSTSASSRTSGSPSSRVHGESRPHHGSGHSLIPHRRRRRRPVSLLLRLVDPNTVVGGWASLPRRPQHPCTRQHIARLRHQLHLLFPAD